MPFTLQGGNFQLTGGGPVANGSVALTLSNPSATIINGGGPAPASYIFNLDANSNFPPGSQAYGNAELTPPGTFYTAKVTTAAKLYHSVESEPGHLGLHSMEPWWRRRFGSQGIAQSQQPEKSTIASHRDHRQPLRFEFSDGRSVDRNIDSLGSNKSRTANHKARIAKPRFDPLIGHGKTALVKALTGIDADRLERKNAAASPLNSASPTLN